VTFAAPLALLALLLAPIVVLLHAIAARWTSREVSSLAFWEEALREMRASLRIRRLLRSLALLASILAIAALVVGLAEPLVELPGGTPAGDTVLVLDATASMAVRSAGTSRYEEAKAEGLALAAGLGRGARMCVVAAGAAPRVLVPFTADREEIRRAITASSATDEPGSPADSLLFALGLRQAGRAARVVFVTDGAFASLGDAEPDRTGVRVLVVGARADNAGITAMSFRRTAAGGVELFVAVAASAGMPRSIPLVVSAGGKDVLRREVALGADGRGSVGVPWKGPTGGRVTARIQVDDGLAADDEAFAVFAPARRLRVLLVGRRDVFLEAALERFPGVTLRKVDAVDPVSGARELEGYDLAVFNGGDPPPLERGNVVVFGTVPPGLPLEPRSVVTGPRFTSWDRGHPLLASLALGPVSIERALQVAIGAGVKVVARSRDIPLVATWERVDLRVLFVAFQPSWSDLTRRTAFPVFVANALDWFSPGVLGADATSHRTGETVEIGIPADAREARVSGPDGREAPWPVTAGVLSLTGTSRAGFYRVDAAGTSQDVAVSLCDPSETAVDFRYAEATPGSTTGPEAEASSGGEHRFGDSARYEPAWFAFVLAGLLLVVAEGLLWAVRSPALGAVQRPHGAAASRAAGRESAAQGAVRSPHGAVQRPKTKP